MQQPPKRGKEPSSQQIQRLKKLPQYLHINSKEFILYNLVDKESNSGLFKNERLLILNARQEYLCYLSKIPPYLIPFQSEDEVNHQQAKQKLFSNEIYEKGQSRFESRMIVDKNGIEIKVGRSDKKIEWVYYFCSKELMEEWYGHINFIFTRTRKEVDQKYHLPPQEPIKPNQPMQPPEKNTLNLSQELSNKPSEHEPPQSKKLDDGELEEIKPVHDQKQSQFNEFSENAPLGRFVREERKYNTESGIERKNAGIIYNPSPRNQTSVKKSQSAHSKESNISKLKSNVRSIDKQSSVRNEPSRLKKQTPPSINWNLLYYQGRDQICRVYFDFVEQCTKFATSLVDRLPLTKQIDSFEIKGPYFYTNNNGVAYKIAFAREQTSLIDGLSDKNANNLQNYEVYQELRRQFFEQRKAFFKSKDEKPAIVCFIAYKGLSFLCRAESQQSDDRSQASMFKRSNMNEDSLLRKIEDLELFIISTADLYDIMRYLNAASLNWTYLYHQTSIKVYKVYFLNQMLSDVFVDIVNSELAHLYRSYHFDSSPQANVDELATERVLSLVNQLFGKGKESDQLWEVVLAEVGRRFKLQVTKESILPGYLLFSVIFKAGISVREGVNMKNTFVLFKKNKAIERANVEGFKPTVSCLNYQLMSDVLLQIKDNLQSPSENNQELEMLVNHEEYQCVPPHLDYLAPKVNIQLSKTIPYSPDHPLSIYACMLTDTPVQNHYEIVLSAISWLLQGEKQEEAFDLSFIKIEELIFWAGKTPIISLFYESFAEYYLTHHQHQKAIEQIKLSTKNLADIFGTSSNKLLQKKEELSQLLLSLGRRDESLKELYECKNICESNEYQSSSTYTRIIISISKLNLSMAKYNESISHSMICLRQLQSRGEKQELFSSEQSACEFLSVGELLLRAFQLTNKREELFEIISLCAQRCENVDSVKAYKRLFKMVLFPHIKRLNLKQSQIYLAVVQQLNTIYKQSSFRQQHLYEGIKERGVQAEINKKLKYQFKNIIKFYDEIVKKKILQDLNYGEDQYFREKVDRNQVETFIRETFLLSNFVGVGFVQAVLKDVYYD